MKRMVQPINTIAYGEEVLGLKRELKKDILLAAYSKRSYKEALELVREVRSNFDDSSLIETCNEVAAEIKKDALSKHLID